MIIRTEVEKPMKKAIHLSTLSDLHVAYVGNGASVEQIEVAMRSIRHIDPTTILFGKTFEETHAMNAFRFNILDDLNTDMWPIEAPIARPVLGRVNKELRQ